MPASAKAHHVASAALQHLCEPDLVFAAVSANRAGFLYLIPALWPALPSIDIERLEDQRRGGLKLREAMQPCSFDINLLKL